MSFLTQEKRTHYCGDLRGTDADKTVVLMGWVHQVRDMGGQVFALLRDRTGMVQLRFDKGTDLFDAGRSLRQEWVVGVKGLVHHRGEDVNKQMATGEVEIVVSTLEALNKTETPPFVIRDETDANEDLRLKYRYLDLRRPSVQHKLLERARATSIIRRYFDEQGFVDIETPTLMKSTPEGARDFLVPSRLHHGGFYALPQSPQIYKQICMVAGFDRYYQIARCFRDEDLRADRQLEFTQVDVEMSFVDEDDIMGVIEGVMQQLATQIANVDVALPIQRLTYAESMNRFGKDAPDMRWGMELYDVGDIFADSDFGVFKGIVDKGGSVRAITVPGGSSKSRKDLDNLQAFVGQYGAKGLGWVKVADGNLTGPISRFLQDGLKDRFIATSKAADGDLVLMIAGDFNMACASLAALRSKLGPEICPENAANFEFCWVYDFPMFEHDEDEDRWVAMHHPFTQPRPEHVERLDSSPGEALARAYDICLNGVELGGGSIRIHSPELQAKIFTALGISDEEAEAKFGFLLEALKYGAPPHGGIALGLDRVIMMLTGCDSIREVIAFPKTTSGTDLMAGSPTTVDPRQLEELGLKLK